MARDMTLSVVAFRIYERSRREKHSKPNNSHNNG